MSIIIINLGIFKCQKCFPTSAIDLQMDHVLSPFNENNQISHSHPLKNVNFYYYLIFNQLIYRMTSISMHANPTNYKRF